MFGQRRSSVAPAPENMSGLKRRQRACRPPTGHPELLLAALSEVTAASRHAGDTVGLRDRGEG